MLSFVYCIIILSIVNCTEQDCDAYGEPTKPTSAKRKIRYTEDNDPDIMYDTTIYQFPDISQILGNEDVKSAMREAWKKTLSAAKEDGSRCEYGFYVYYDYVSHVITCDEPLAGPRYPKDERCTLFLPPSDRGLEICAFFHTHTPYTYCSERVSRPTGLSPEDKAAANDNHWPGILYDFDVSVVSRGHSLEIPPKTILFGPSQRPDTMIVDSIPL